MSSDCSVRARRLLPGSTTLLPSAMYTKIEWQRRLLGDSLLPASTPAFEG